MALVSGQVVDRRYRIMELLAQGGMGAIYKAWDTRLNRPIALKEMLPQPGLDAEMLEQLHQQFENEAQVLATLSHPNLVRVTDYFYWDDKEYLVMDFVEGQSLAQIIEREGPQSEESVLQWMAQLLDALAYCHRRGVLHRDIKPQNIIITTEGNAVLVDFGLVKLWDPTAPETKTVMRGAGTPEYAPPEQYDVGMGHTDPRSDIYSLGATLYHVFTGRVPPTATQRMANPTSFIPPCQINTQLSPEIETGVLKAMEVAMPLRFQSAQQMAEQMGFSLRQQLFTPPRLTPSGTVILGEGQEQEAQAERPTTRPPEHKSDPLPPAPPSAQVQVPPRPSTRPPEQESRPGRPSTRPPRSRPRRRRTGLWLTIAGAGLVCLLLVGGCFFLAAIGGASITPTPRAHTPIPTASSADALLADDFSQPTSGWETFSHENGGVGYESGHYFVRCTHEDRVIWGRAEQDFADLIVDVEATQVEAPENNNNGYGVACRLQPNGDGYLMRISGDGYYSIYRILEGSFEALVEWTRSDNVRQGNDSNHIQAICNGSELALVVNGEMLARTTDTTFTSGDIALAATTYEEHPTEIHFDDVYVIPPESDGSQPGSTPLPAGEVLFEDDFENPTSGWKVWDSEGDVAGYSAGQYRILSLGNGWMWGRANRHFTDVEIEVVSTQASAPDNNNNGYGVLCRVQGGQSIEGYALVISGDGFYAIFKIEDGDVNPLVDWTQSHVIHQGDETNVIRAMCDGTRLALIVNGQLMAETEDDAFSSGDVGLTAFSYEDEATEIHFDDLVVRRPSR